MIRSALALIAFAVGATYAPSAAALDWDAVSDEEEIEVITTDPDGRARRTTIWLAVLDGQGYIRTSNTSWWENISRSDRVTLRIRGTEHPLRAVKIRDDELFGRVKAIFREKYGFRDRIITPFRRGEIKILRMEPQ